MCSSSRNSLRVYPFPFFWFFKKRTKTSCILWLLLLFLLLLLIGNVLVVVSLKFLCYSSLRFQLFEIIFVLLFSLKIIGGGMITFVAYYFLSLSLSLVCFLFVILGIGITSSGVGVVVLDSLDFHYHFFYMLSVVGIWVFLSKDRFFSKMKKTPHYPLKEIVAFLCALYPVLYMYSDVTLLGVMAASPLLGFVRRAFECIVGRFGNREGKLLVWLLITAFCLMVKMAAFLLFVVSRC